MKYKESMTNKAINWLNVYILVGYALFKSFKN
jgi:hypothetical protein